MQPHAPQGARICRQLQYWHVHMRFFTSNAKMAAAWHTLHARMHDLVMPPAACCGAACRLGSSPTCKEAIAFLLKSLQGLLSPRPPNTYTYTHAHTRSHKHARTQAQSMTNRVSRRPSGAMPTPCAMSCAERPGGHQRGAAHPRLQVTRASGAGALLHSLRTWHAMHPPCDGRERPLLPASSCAAYSTPVQACGGLPG